MARFIDRFWRATCLCLAAVMLPGAVPPPRRVLHVSLYPYIPQPEAAALALKQGFERLHPDVIIDVTLNPNYYDPDPAKKGVLTEDADVHTIDAVFLRDFIDRHKLAPLPAAFTASLPASLPLAAEAVVQQGRVVAVPYWMCADFLIYRNDVPALGTARTLPELEHALSGSHGLLIDMAAPALPELYYSTLMARLASPRLAFDRMTAVPDGAIVARLRRLLALAPAGLGRSLDYDARGSFYARQFARRAGPALVGYSEMTHEVLDETRISCRIEDDCVTAAQIGIAPFPFEDNQVRPAIWVDAFGIDARVHGRTMIDAQDFIRYAVSLTGYRALLVPRPGEPPRYLLPATQGAFADPAILAAAPLYPKFRAIIDKGTVLVMPHQSEILNSAARAIDAALTRASATP